MKAIKRKITAFVIAQLAFGIIGGVCLINIFASVIVGPAGYGNFITTPHLTSLVLLPISFIGNVVCGSNLRLLRHRYRNLARGISSKCNPILGYNGQYVYNK